MIKLKHKDETAWLLLILVLHYLLERIKAGFSVYHVEG